MVKILMTLEGLLANKLRAVYEYKIRIISDALPIPREKFFSIPRSPSYPRPPERNWKIKLVRKKPVLLAVSGWWQDLKNLHTALEVFSKVLEETDEDLEFWIVGKFFEGKYQKVDEDKLIYIGEYDTGKEYENKIKSLIERLEIKENVKFLGVKTGQNLKEIFLEAKIYYLPIKVDGFSRTLRESMHCGTPIVTTPYPPRKKIIENSGCGYACSSEEKQKEAILTLLKDEKKYKQIQKCCLEKAENLRWEHISIQWEELLNNLENS